MKKYLVFFLFVNILLAYWWSNPKNLGIQGVDDINAQACREQVNGHTCMVFQTLLNSNWDILSRFGTGSDWLGDTTWSDTFRVTQDTFADINPSVAYDESSIRYWCAWQNNSTGNWDIYISCGDTLNGWSTPYQVTSDMTNDQSPSVLAHRDTVWVVWQSENGVCSCYYDGSVWSIPVEIAPIGYNPKINRRNDHPFVVFDDSIFIYYSDYLGGAWQTPQRITFDYWHERPEIVASDQGYSGAWITWQSYRDGNYEVYSTVCDSFLIHQRITNNDSIDFETSGLFYLAIDKDRQYYEVPALAFSTDRNGNFDIYNYWSWGGGWDTLVAVDTNVSEDRNPVMTGGGFSLWILWQTDRNTDWDVYGSTVCVNSIEETNDLALSQLNDIKITPNPFKGQTRIASSCGTGNAKRAELKIYDASGKLVRNSGLFTSYPLVPAVVFWDGTDNQKRRLPAGVYFVKLFSDLKSTIKKVVLIE
jgi:hypothetical protein